MKLRPFSFSELKGPPLKRIGESYVTLQKLYKSIRVALNANENPVLLDEQEVTAGATLDLGDINWDALYLSYGFLRVDLKDLIPITDGDYLQIRYGGNGLWWTTGAYSYNLVTYTNTVNPFAIGGQTQIICWGNNPLWTQGNQPGLEELQGKLYIALRDATALSSHPCFCSMMWANTSSAPIMGHVNGRNWTTNHLTALRFYYAGGNMHGKARLWGLPVS